MPAANCHDCATSPACVLGRLEQAERELLMPQIRARILHRDDVLFEEGASATHLHVIKLGTALAYRRGLDGHSRPIGVVSRGTAFGVPGLFESAYQLTLIALTTVRVCELPVAALRAIRGCDAKLVVQLFRALVDNYAGLAAWSEAMRLPGTLNQLAYVVVLLADANGSSVLELPSQSALADLLGTRRETIARALRSLEGDGAVRRLGRGRLEVDRGKLLARLSQAIRQGPPVARAPILSMQPKR